MKLKVAVLFGGKSTEHEISIISAIQAIGYINKEKYDVIPVYMTKNNDFYVGDSIGNIEEYTHIKELIAKSTQVIFVKEGDKVSLMRYPMKKFGNNVAAVIDVALPIVHGTNVEDGALQGYLQTLDLPYVGCDVLASAVGMDKFVMKILLKDAGFEIESHHAGSFLKGRTFSEAELRVLIDGVLTELPYWIKQREEEFAAHR